MPDAPPPDLYASAALAGYTANGYRDLYDNIELAILVGERARHPYHRAVVDHVWAAALAWYMTQLADPAQRVAALGGVEDLDAAYARICEEGPGPRGTEPGA